MKAKILISYPLPGDPNRFLSHATPPDVWINPVEEILPRSTLLKHLPGVAGIVVTPGDGPINDEIFEAAGPQLKVVSCYSVGYDYVDIESARKKQIAVGITPDATTEPTADIAWLLILGVARKLNQAINVIREHRWSGIAPGDQYGHRLAGKTLFIVGGGRIGTAVARRSLGWQMKIIYLAQSDKPELEAAPYWAKRVTLEEGLQQADIVSLHVPLNAQTHHMIGRDELELMNNSAIIINTARGGIIDERDLIDALRHEKIGGAGLDVFDNEPHINPELYALNNCLMLPHIGTATVEDRQWMTQMAMENLIAGIADEPLPYPIPDNQKF